ncbi:MAG TPA: Uma2 family endonuclease [Candidatus Obscuribacterales bacterium]
MSTPARELQLSMEEYLEIEEKSAVRHEYVSGRMFAMVGATEAHDAIVNNLNFRIRSQIQGSECRIFSSSMKVLIEATGNFYYPDLMVSCEPYSPKSVFKRAPCLIVEVLSPSTKSTDQREKLQAYQTIDSLSEYAIVFQDERRIELYKRAGRSWIPTIYEAAETVLLNPAPNLQIVLPLDEVYEGVLDFLA